MSSHILPLPLLVTILRGLQLLIGIILLGLSAWGISGLSFDGASLSLFTAIITLIIGVYNIVSFYSVKAAYNYWASLALDILAIVFWITSMGLMASFVSSFSTYSGYSGCYYGFCYKRDLHPRTIYATDTWIAAMKAVAGLAGLEVILFTTTLIFTSIFLHKHRAAGGHSMPSKANTTPSGNGGTGVTSATIPPQYQERKDIEMEAGSLSQQGPPQSQQSPVYTAPIPTAPAQQVTQ
ncbi:hypothetical protein HYALB_00005958 [Hymenoscyphus albidus]|uniref:MARVEL domain-containing protein n=1 Tax=Hymenoscyphus albidus TaxID=595503 RepID=A0A9N9PX46_9HELO|nr:hypothetical protein HYALB_00005958 [Hymenoscyphus albidus]